MKKPNWSKWLLMREVKVWQACALALGFEPPKNFEDLSIRRNTLSRGFPTDEVVEKYEDLLEVLIDNLSDENYFNIYVNPQRNKFGNVRLDAFVAWATSKVDWLKLPPEMLPPKRVTKESDLKIKDERTFRFLCPVENNDYNNFGGYTLKEDGLYINQAMIEYCKSSDSTLNEDETYELLWHPTGDHAQPVLKFDCCTLTDLRAFALNSSLDCIDEDAVAELLAKPPEVNPPSASDAGQAGDVKSSALEGNVDDDVKKSLQKTPSDTGKDGADIRTIKRLNDININNKHKKKFNSLPEVYEFFLKEYESKSEESPTLKEPHIYAEIARVFGAGCNGNLLFQGTSIKTQVSKIRPKK